MARASSCGWSGVCGATRLPKRYLPLDDSAAPPRAAPTAGNQCLQPGDSWGKGPTAVPMETACPIARAGAAAFGALGVILHPAGGAPSPKRELSLVATLPTGTNLRMVRQGSPGHVLELAAVSPGSRGSTCPSRQTARAPPGGGSSFESPSTRSFSPRRPVPGTHRAVLPHKDGFSLSFRLKSKSPLLREAPPFLTHLAILCPVLVSSVDVSFWGFQVFVQQLSKSRSPLGQE